VPAPSIPPSLPPDSAAQPPPAPALGVGVSQQESGSFLKKKNQKTFIRYSSRDDAARTPQMNRSLFASFSSEKEDLPFANFYTASRTNGAVEQ
jgi:hypothetical protein